jgi:hypothetical protein
MGRQTSTLIPSRSLLLFASLTLAQIDTPRDWHNNLKLALDVSQKVGVPDLLGPEDVGVDKQRCPLVVLV